MIRPGHRPNLRDIPEANRNPSDHIIMKTIPVLLVLCSLATALTVSSCNTVSGLGEDIQRGGQALERSAR